MNTGKRRTALVWLWTGLFVLMAARPVPGVRAAGGLTGDYAMENEKGLVGELRIRELSGGRIRFDIHAAIPGLCGDGRTGVAVPRGGRIVWSDDSCGKLTLDFQGGRVRVTPENCGFGGEGNCTFAGDYTNAESASLETTEEIIREIRRHYAAVNIQTDRLNDIQLELTGFSTEGGKLKALLDEDDLRYVEVELFGEMGRRLQLFYFWQGRLFFSFVKNWEYDSPHGAVRAMTEDRFYFDRDKLIRWLDPKQEQVPSTDPRYSRWAAKIKEDAAMYVRAVRSGRETVSPQDLAGSR